jgi:hypothetical protein
MFQRFRRSSLAVVVIFLLAMLLVIVLCTSPRPSSPPLPSPNGYDDFISASRMVTSGVDDNDLIRGIPPRDWTTWCRIISPECRQTRSPACP